MIDRTAAPAMPNSFASLPLEQCALASVIELIGDRATLLILRETFFGVRRFDQLHADTALPRTVLSRRLDRLVAGGILEKSVYREPGRRGRYEYVLTPRGQDLMLSFAALMDWGEIYLRPGRRRPLTLHDAATGERVAVRFVTAFGRVLEDIGDVRARFAREPGSR